MSEWGCEHGRSFDLCHECLNKEARTFRQLHHEAAQRIRELEGDCERLRQALRRASILENRIRELEAENERLREALEHIARLESDFRSDPELYAGVSHDKASVARKALEEKP